MAYYHNDHIIHNKQLVFRFLGDAGIYCYVYRISGIETKRYKRSGKFCKSDEVGYVKIQNK